MWGVCAVCVCVVRLGKTTGSLSLLSASDTGSSAFPHFPLNPVESLCTNYLSPLDAPVWAGVPVGARSGSSSSTGGREAARKGSGVRLPPALSVGPPEHLSRSGAQREGRPHTQRLDHWDQGANHWLGTCGTPCDRHRGLLRSLCLRTQVWREPAGVADTTETITSIFIFSMYFPMQSKSTPLFFDRCPYHQIIKIWKQLFTKAVNYVHSHRHTQSKTCFCENGAIGQQFD